MLSSLDGWGEPLSSAQHKLRDHLVPPAARRIEELQHSLQKKDVDLRAMEERYRRYVDRARLVRMLGAPLVSFPGHCFPLGILCLLSPHLSYRITSQTSTSWPVGPRSL